MWRSLNPAATRLHKNLHRLSRAAQLQLPFSIHVLLNSRYHAIFTCYSTPGTILYSRAAQLQLPFSIHMLLNSRYHSIFAGCSTTDTMQYSRAAQLPIPCNIHGLLNSRYHAIFTGCIAPQIPFLPQCILIKHVQLS
jgi:hypothetical protein